MKITAVLSTCFLFLSITLLSQVDVEKNNKWELRLTPFYYLNNDEIGSLDNGSSITSAPGTAVALTIGRRFPISSKGNISLIPRLGAEFYPSSKIKFDLKPPTLPESSDLTFLRENYVDHEFALGIRLGLDLEAELGSSQWSVYGGGGCLWLPIDVNSEFGIGSLTDYPYKRVRTTEQYLILLGRLNAGVSRQFIMNDTKFNLSLGYMKSFKSNQRKEVHHLRVNEDAYEVFEYQRGLDAIEISFSLNFG